MKRSGPLALLGRGVVVLALGACAGLTQQQSDRLKEAQDIATQTTKLYGVPHVSVFSYEMMSPDVAGGYAPHQGLILLRRSTLDDKFFLPVLAHELGHVTLGHEYDVVGGGGRIPGRVDPGREVREGAERPTVVSLPRHRSGARAQRATDSPASTVST